jgi:hypothetical protein
MFLRSLCIFFLLCLSLPASSQFNKAGHFAVGPMYQIQLLGKSRAFEAVYGIQVSYFIRDRLSLEYSLAYTQVPFQPNYIKVYGGGILAGYGVLQAVNTVNVTGQGWWTLALLSLVIPEGISYHFPVNEQLVVSPYLNLLTVDIGDSYWRMSNTLGVRLNMILGEKLNLAPYGFVMAQYRGNSAGGSVGGYGVGVLGRWVF